MLDKRVYELRTKAGLSQRELEASTGVAHTTISRIEKGDVKAVRPTTLKKLSLWFGVSVDYLLGLKYEPEPNLDTFLGPELAQLVRIYSNLSVYSQAHLHKVADLLILDENRRFLSPK